jgi:hypothetical protein
MDAWFVRPLPCIRRSAQSADVWPGGTLSSYARSPQSLLQPFSKTEILHPNKAVLPAKATEEVSYYERPFVPR